MANNCLVTKLKDVVDNENLLKLDEFMIDVYQVESPTNQSQAVFFTEPGIDANFECTIIGDGYFTQTYGGSSIGKTVTLSKTNYTVYCSNGNYKIKVTNKYAVRYISGPTFNVPSITFKYCPIYIINMLSNQNGYHYDGVFCEEWAPTLNKINIRTEGHGVSYNLEHICKTFKNLKYLDFFHSTTLSGDIKHLKEINEIIDIQLSITDISGDISDLYDLNITRLNQFSIFKRNNVTGALEDLISAWRTQKESGSLATDTTETKITIFGTTITTGSRIEWTANTITCNGHTYDNNGTIIN